MRKFLSTLSILNLLLPFFQIANAESYKFLDGRGLGNKLMIYGISSTGNSTLLNTYSGSDEYLLFDWAEGHVDEYRGKVYVDAREYNDPARLESNKTASYLLEYDFIENTFTKKDNLPEDLLLYPVGVKNMISEKSDGSIQIGKDANDIDITPEGLSINGEPVISKKANGELHIGKNSWITKEENGRQKVWAKDAAGNSIPIDYTNGTKLLINGRDVEQSINNVGALSAALTGLPTVPADTTLACGLGTGTHGGDFAFSGGCASKVNDELSINYAASMTMPGQDYAGDFEDKFSARAGFVWQLGKTKKDKLLSKQQRQFDQKITNLKEENKELKSLIAKQNARLEKLEKLTLALKLNPNSEVISIAK